ncbi:DNA polymerase III subunit beta [Patescibacteria group bacterium]|nr:DNA polymerase III subunit beta [Patescibacteria group bacterium]
MKFSCSKEQLDKQLQQVARIITVRNSLPVLSNVLLETDDKILRISGTDLEIAMTTYLPAKVEQEGTFTVPAKVFQEFIHQNPDDTINFSLESFELVCRSQKVTGRIAGIDADEFPPLPKVEKATKVRLPFLELVDALKQVVIACAIDQARPVLTGVYMQLTGGAVTLAATDSFRLVERKIPIIPIQESLTVLLPGRTAQELIRLAGSYPDAADIEMEIGDQQVLLRLGTVEIYSRLITGSFPKYQSIIPTGAVAVAEVTTSELVQALRLSSVFSQAGVSNVMLEVDGDGAFSVASYGSQKGSTRHTIYALVQDGFQPLKTAFNAKFLLDACTACGADHLQLRFSGPTTALLIATEAPDYLQLVMPIRLDS